MAKHEYFVHFVVNVDEGDGSYEKDEPGIAYDPDFMDNATKSDMMEVLRNLRKSDILDFYDASEVTVKPV